MACAGAVVSKPTAKKTTCFVGFSLAIFRQSSGEYRMRTSPPLALMPKRSASLPGTRSMSPKQQKMTSGRGAMCTALSISSSGVTHTGQPGPCTSFNLFGQQLIQPELDDGMRLSAANFHQRPGASGDAVDLLRERLRGSRVAIFAGILHGFAPPSGESWPSSPSSSISFR